MDWLIANIGTLAVIVILAAVVLWIVLSLRRDKKAGKSTCGSNCAHCAMYGQCHKKTTKSS